MFKALYDYKSDYSGALSFCTGDQFTVIDSTNSDWWTVQNGFGEVGYVPVNYISEDTVAHAEVLRSIDRALEAIHYQATDAGGKYTHQQRKNLHTLLQHRKNVVEQQRVERGVIHGTTSHSKKRAPEPPKRDGHSEQDHAEKDKGIKKRSSKRGPPPPPPTTTLPHREDEDWVHVNLAESSTTDEELSKQHRTATSPPKKSMSPVKSKLLSHTEISDSLGLEMVEAVRRNTDLSYDKSKTAIGTVLEMLKENAPQTAAIVDKILETILQQNTAGSTETSHDAERLRVIFSEMMACKDDSQQRSWSLYQDEAIITEYLEELISILSKANPSICRSVIAHDHYEPVHTLVVYYQMESRTPIRLLLLQIFGALCGLDAEIITMLLCSILPLELARDIQTDTSSIQKLCYSTLLLTMIFSSGETVPFNHYDHLNEVFVDYLLETIENPPSSDIEEQLSDMFVHLILAFNLHFQSSEDNKVMKVLAKHGTAKTFTEKVMLLVNRGSSSYV